MFFLIDLRALGANTNNTFDSDATDYSISMDPEQSHSNKKRFSKKKSADLDIEARTMFKEISINLYECNLCLKVSSLKCSLINN